ncbi:fungal-specific transcription factor domain-containing protein [Elsinoe ampelina]|uniref:Fungal-specific transcription factor domain-containing protein n=1 Tax=Elsinoe ampelina TaxID=302913 RepID=A0A6A6GM63_9PEZI|nr:fungal-specific transcription factor domain-containing protein [Elsinoe ampelina]
MNPNRPVPTPPSTNSSTGASPNDAQFRVVRKRNRVPLSCAPCRHRKLKCNRGHPCDNCTKRGDTPNCTYASTATRKRPGAGAGSNGTPDDMQNRIDRLESLVLSLMSNGNSSAAASAQAALNNARSSSIAGTSQSAGNSYDQDADNAMEEDHDEDSDVNTVSQGLGIMKVAEGKTMFVSEAHWYAILANIAEVKKFYAEHLDEYKAQVRKVEASQDDDAPGGTLFFKAPRLSSREEVLAHFPTKQQTDTLIGRYFNSYDPSVHIIHGPTFQKQYDEHWSNPSESSLPFVAIMYAMMALALQSYDRAGDEPPEYIGRSLSVSVVFRRLTAQTLVLVGITEPVPQIVEAMILHLQAEYARGRDTESGILILVSMTVRIAMRMGYHRDAGPHPTVTPFQAEMRRRVWMMIRQSDLLFSFQAGLPSVSRADCSDTQLPRNLYDDELYEDMPALPPSRPESEPTPMSYMIAKARLSQVFGVVVDRLGSVSSPPSYDEILDIDKQLKEVRAKLPPHLRVRPLHESMTEPANILMQRLGLELLYLKSQCVLHRRFLSRGRESARFDYSRRSCIDASMDMLTHQAMLHHESQPGGRLHSVKWYISSLTTHDFLLAAMIVCLELHHLAEAERTGRKGSATSSPMNDFVDERRDEMLSAIRHSMNIWESLRDRSMEAWKASTTLRVMLEKLMALRNVQTEGQTPPANGLGAMGQRQTGKAYTLSHGMASFGGVPMGDDKGAEQAAAMTLGLLSSGGVSPGQYPAPQQGQNGSPAGTSTIDSKPYPASMAGLLNDPVSQEGRTGLTPGYTGNLDAASPFSQMFGQAGSVFDNLTQGGNEVDWGAWDSFIQGTAMDPVTMWPSVPDVAGGAPIDPAIGGQGSNLNGIAVAAQGLVQGQGQSQGQKDGQISGVGSGSATTFMGAQGNGLQWVGK